MDGTPLLPGVMGTEAFAELASLLAPGYRVVSVESEEFLSPFKFYRSRPRTLLLSAHAASGGERRAVGAHRARIERSPPGGVDQRKSHFIATVRLARETEMPASPAAAPVPAPRKKAWSTGAESIYKVYFHGPSYQVLEKVWVDGDTATGLLATALPPDTQPQGAPLLISPRLVEFCFQTAGIWEIAKHKELALPMALRRVTAYRPYPAEEDGRLYALVHAGAEGFHAEVVDEAGQTYVRLEGYRTVRLPGRTVELG